MGEVAYGESAFADVDISSFEMNNVPSGYGYLPCSMPIENRNEVIPDFIESMKENSVKINN